MKKQNEVPAAEHLTASDQSAQVVDEMATGKKQFVEPEITYAVDVLEATTFFQQADTGVAP